MVNTFDVLNLDKEALRISAEIYISSKKNSFEIIPLDALIAGISKRYGVKRKIGIFSGIDRLEVHRASSYIFSTKTLKFLRLNR